MVMTIPKYNDLFNPLLKAMHNLGSSASISEQEEEVAKILGLSDEDITKIQYRNCTVFSNRLAWARHYLKRYGLLNNSVRGIWALTPEGRKTENVSKAKVDRFVKKLGSKSEDSVDGALNNDKEPEEIAWQNVLLEKIKAVSPDAFERLCQRLLREAGFTQVEVTGKSGDGGIDGKGIIRIGGLLSFPIIFQCKRYQGSVSASVVRDFRGAMIGRAEKGLILTTGTFSPDAKKEAKRDGAPPVDLVDGQALAEKLRELRLGLVIKQKTIEDISVDDDFFRTL
ncbi:MAG: restriction endonuclease [Candidatus Auribacter fodinae]|jgi:restriction system protein|uniref:Restriction endonuclease n=1 Tax=Candidatus Auribacter fodinae TaxID=2093366 RepID=A0A3A4QTN4_9BACT|nr:MAG: restriction endonuclease [Candidatus Auribacter fodinae]